MFTCCKEAESQFSLSELLPAWNKKKTTKPKPKTTKKPHHNSFSPICFQESTAYYYFQPYLSLQQVTSLQPQTVPGCASITCLLIKSSRCSQHHKHPPQFEFCTTDPLEVIWVLLTFQCLISCIISHACHYVSEVSLAQNQNSSKRNPGKKTLPKQISTIILHT